MLPDSKLTILHTEASNGWGGQEIRILSEAEWFRDQGYRIILANPQNGQLNAKARARGFEVFDIPFEKKTQLRDFFRVRKLIQDHKPDVIGTHSSVDSWVGLLAASLCRVPCRLRYRHVSTPVHKRLTEWDSRGGAKTQREALDFYKKSRANTSSMLSKFTDPPSDETTGSVVLERRKCRVQSHIPALFRNFLKSSGEGDEVNFTSIPHFCPPASIIKSTS